MKDFLWRLASKFAPTYKASKGEKCFLVELENRKMPRIFRAYPAWRPYVYFSARRLSPRGECVAFEINYLTIWDRDTGGRLGDLVAHVWDTERSALLVTGPKENEDPDLFKAKEAYFAAHEGVPLVDKSRYYACRSHDRGVDVFWSEGKHASYPDNPCKYFRIETFETPPLTSKPGDYALVNAGTIEKALVPWVLNASWGSGVGSVNEKLSNPLWDRDSWESIKRVTYTKETVRAFQQRMNLRATGNLNEETIAAVYDTDYRLIENMDKFSKKSFRNLHRSTIRGKDMDLVAQKELSDGKIERIVRNDLHGRSLKKYLMD